MGVAAAATNMATMVVENTSRRRSADLVLSIQFMQSAALSAMPDFQNTANKAAENSNGVVTVLLFAPRNQRRQLISFLSRQFLARHLQKRSCGGHWRPRENVDTTCRRADCRAFDGAIAGVYT
jgi:hypothetical protein